MAQIEVVAGTGAPTRGRHRLDDTAIDDAGTIWRCTVPGRPGTWAQVGGGSGASVLTLATRHVTSAELLALSTPDPTDPITSLEIVAAPGAGKFIYPVTTSWRWNPGTTPYTVPDGMYLVLSTEGLWAGGPFGDLWLEMPCIGALDQGSAKVFVRNPSARTGVLDPALFVNQPLVLMNDRPGQYADGDGTIDLKVLYYLADA